MSQMPYEQRAVTREMSLQACLASVEESPITRRNLENLRPTKPRAPASKVRIPPRDRAILHGGQASLQGHLPGYGPLFVWHLAHA